ncbi:MAG: F0F1 ATP synthase subunit epsilon [Hyphomicrobiales bacterium]
MADPFKFELVAPERQLLSANATQVVVPGGDGYFTVLKGHAPVLTTLKAGMLEVSLEGGEQRRFFVRGGFADTGVGGLTVLAEEAVPAETLDAERLAQSVKNLEEDIADARTPAVRADAEQKLIELREVIDALKQEGIG